MNVLGNKMALNTRALTVIALELRGQQRADLRAQLLARADTLLDMRWELMPECSCKACADAAAGRWTDVAVVDGTPWRNDT